MLVYKVPVGSRTTKKVVRLGRLTMAKAEKIDLYKKHKDEYVTPKKPTLVNTRPAS